MDYNYLPSLSHLEYLKNRDLYFDGDHLCSFLLRTVFCSKGFLDNTQFVYWSFPLYIRDGILFGILIDKDLIQVSNQFCSPEIGLQSLNSGSIITLQYRIVETEDDGLSLQNDARNQLECEIFIAVVNKSKYIDEIKRLTLSQAGKRIPFYLQNEDTERFIKGIQSKEGVNTTRFNFEQDHGRTVVTPSGCNLVRSHQRPNLITPFYELEYNLLKNTKCVGVIVRSFTSFDLSGLNSPLIPLQQLTGYK